MVAINFDEPSEGQVASDRNALAITNNGAGNSLWANTISGEGVHGETNSDRFAAVAGIQLNENPPQDLGPAGVYGEGKGKCVGIWGKSQRGEGVHGETNSDRFGAVVGLQLNPNSFAAGIFGRGRIAGRFEGDVEVTGDVRLLGADCAEEFDGGVHTAEPGTVMVLSSEDTLEPGSKAYDKRVAGVVSGAGGYKPGIILDKKQESNNNRRRIPLALMGKVYCKVDADYSPIEVGDLLTTSPTVGHAMKASDPINAFGTVIGKALRSLKQGKGLIPILISMQ